MPRIKIKQLDERFATAGLHMGGGPERRKLEPGEVLELEEGELLDLLWNTGKLEITLDEVTRPLDYENYREAELCSPTFKSRGPDVDIQVEQARKAVAERLAKQSEAPEPPESPVEDIQPEPVAEEPPAAKPTARNRRAERRAAAKAAQRGEALTA